MGTTVTDRRGPHRLLRHNARTFAAQDPGRYLYAEGLVLAKGSPEAHGWVIDRLDGSVIEVTTGYGEAIRYQGMAFEVERVEEFLDNNGRREEYRSYLRGELYSEAPGVLEILFAEIEDGELSARGFADALRSVLGKR